MFYTIVMTFFAVDCGVPEAPTNGSVAFYSSTVLGGSAIYLCDNGFKPTVLNATCERSATWKPAPLCTQIGKYLSQ